MWGWGDFIYYFHGLWEEAVQLPAGSAADAHAHLSRWEVGEDAVGEVMRVLNESVGGWSLWELNTALLQTPFLKCGLVGQVKGQVARLTACCEHLNLHPVCQLVILNIVSSFTLKMSLMRRNPCSLLPLHQKHRGPSCRCSAFHNLSVSSSFCGAIKVLSFEVLLFQVIQYLRGEQEITAFFGGHFPVTIFHKVRLRAMSNKVSLPRTTALPNSQVLGKQQMSKLKILWV